MSRFLLPAVLIAILPASAAQAAIYAGADLTFDSANFTDSAPQLFSEDLIGPQLI
jgi:hypothetical protein